MKKEKISDAVIRRLPRYYRYLDELHAKGIVRISSGSLGKRMGITASQIRQDLSCFGEFGQQGYGYNIMELRAEIGHILGVDDKRRLIVVGAGHLGHALLQNFDFDQGGFLFDTAFDVSPAVIGTTVNGVTIRGMDELDAYCTANHPSVAVLTVPKCVAQEVADRLIALGVQGIWNFTNVELSGDVFFENVHFADSVYDYAARLVEKTRSNAFVTLGVSPRGALAVCRAAKANAYLAGRDYVIPDDVAEVFPFVCGHRLILNAKARLNEYTAEQLIESMIGEVKKPDVQEFRK